MALDITFSVDFSTEQGQETKPLNLVMEVVDNDGVDRFRVYGNPEDVGRHRSWLEDGTVGTHLIPLARLGYRNLTNVSDIENLRYQPEGRRRIPIDLIAVPDFLPDIMVSGFTFGTWSPTTGFNIHVTVPPTSPSAITHYVIGMVEDPTWSIEIDAASAEAGVDFDFDPVSVTSFPLGEANPTVTLTIAAAIGTAVAPASAGTEKTLDLTDSYWVGSDDITMVSIDSVGPVGQVDITLAIGSGFVEVAPWELRVNVSGAALSQDDATLANTFPLAVGQTVRVATAVAAASSAHASTFLHNTETDAFITVAADETVVILPLDVPSTPPTLNSGPTLGGLVDHSGINKFDIGVQATCDASFIGTSGSPLKSIQPMLDGVLVGSAVNDGTGTYTPVNADDQKFLSFLCIGYNAGVETQVISASHRVCRVTPTAVGTFTAVEEEINNGAIAVAGATTVAKFTGTGLVFTISSILGGTINSSTGAINFPEQAAAIQETATITATNTGGSVSLPLTVTFSNPAVAPFPPAIDNTLWSMVEVTDPDEAGGAAGKRKVSILGSVVVPSTHTLHASTHTSPIVWAATKPQVSPNIDYTTPTGIAVGSVVFPALGWRNLSTGEFQTASTRNSFVIQGLDDVTPPSAAMDIAMSTPTYNQAYNKGLTSFTSSGGGSNSAFFGSAMLMVAYEAFLGRAAAVPRVISQLKANITATNCPACLGGFTLQYEQRFAATAALAKQTPAVWNGLNDTERLKIDLVVKGLLLAGAYCCSDKNPDIVANPSLGNIRALDGNQNWWKTNPNFASAPPAAVHMARAFLGAGACADFLNTVTIANFKAQLLANGLTRIYNTMNQLPASGTTAGIAGSPTAVSPSVPQVQAALRNWVCKTPTYVGQTVADSQAAAVSMAYYTFPERIMTGTGGTAANGWIGPGYDGYAKMASNPAGLPNKGLPGMAKELNAQDEGPGPRSSMGYAMYGYNIVMDVWHTLATLGLLDRSNAAVIAAATQMDRGVVDLNFKSSTGYLNHEKGDNSTWTDAGDGVTFALVISVGPRVQGYTITRWTEVMWPWLDI